MQNTPAAIAAYWAQHPQWAAEAQAAGHDLSFPYLPTRAVLFDMDGVLFDSMPGHAKAWAEGVQEFGLSMEPIEIYMNEGRTALSTINILTQRAFGRDTTPEEVEKIYARKCEIFNAYPEAPKMEGAEAVLRVVKAAQKTTVVVTGSGQASLLERLITHYPGHFSLDRVVSSRDVQHGKPHPEPYLMGLEKAGVRPWEAIVVENAPLGVQAAVAAEVFTIAVNTGPLPTSVLTDEGANLVLPHMTALAECFASLLRP